MNQTILVRRETIRSEAFAVTLSLLLVLGQVCSLTAQAQGKQSSKKSALTADQRIAHVLSRLTFGARPGDFERVKAIGVNEFIRRQLDSDSVDDVAVQARLRRLPTLGTRRQNLSPRRRRLQQNLPTRRPLIRSLRSDRRRQMQTRCLRCRLTKA